MKQVAGGDTTGFGNKWPFILAFEISFKLVDSNVIPSYTAANRAVDRGGMPAQIAAIEKSLVCNIGVMCALRSKQIIMKLPKFACTLYQIF